MSEQKKKLVAYHEAGHAILGALMCLDFSSNASGWSENDCDGDPVAKIGRIFK